MSAWSSKHTIFTASRGFTLLELVLVLFLVGLLATAGLLFTQNIEDQAQFDDTQRRLELIRKAIIQSGERTVNGRPELSGFVIDNGRLPYCLTELTGPEFAFTDSASAPTTHYQSPCDLSNGLLTIRKPLITDAGLRYGWWGPYIQVNPESNGDRPFRDGYSNDDGGVNFGWNWTLSESATAVVINSLDPDSGVFPQPIDLTVQSSGFDLTDDFDDYPAALTDYLLVANDWLYQQDVTIQFVNTSATSAIDGINSGDENWTLTLAKSTTDPDALASAFTFTPTSSSIPANMGMYEHTTSFSDPIPVGYYRVTIECADGDSCPDSVSNPYTIMILPKQQLAPLRWNLEPE